MPNAKDKTNTEMILNLNYLQIRSFRKHRFNRFIYQKNQSCLIDH